MPEPRLPRVINFGPVTLTPCDEFEMAQEETIVEIDLNDEALAEITALLAENISRSRND